MSASTKLSHGNCFFGILYLVLRGKAYEIIGVSTVLPWWPIHWMCVNRNGAVLHFKRDATVGQEFDPVWFLGRFEGISRQNQVVRLKHSGRTIKFRTKRVRLVTALLLLLWIALVIPFSATLFGMIFWWNFKWAGKAILNKERL